MPLKTKTDPIQMQAQPSCSLYKYSGPRKEDPQRCLFHYYYYYLFSGSKFPRICLASFSCCSTCFLWVSMYTFWLQLHSESVTSKRNFHLDCPASTQIQMCKINLISVPLQCKLFPLSFRDQTLVFIYLFIYF